MRSKLFAVILAAMPAGVSQSFFRIGNRTQLSLLVVSCLLPATAIPAGSPAKVRPQEDGGDT